MYVHVKIDSDDLIEMLVDRVRYWTDDKEELDVYEQYYTNMVKSGCFEDAKLDIMGTVDNDYANYLTLVYRKDYEKEKDEYIKENPDDTDDIIEWEELENRNYDEFPQYSSCPNSYIEAINNTVALVSSC